jgi:hypothetical protein
MRHHLNPLLRAIPIVSILFLASGCATSPGRLNVDLSALKECKRVGGQVPIPAIDDYRKVSALALGGLHKANQRLAARDRCDDKVIAKYATANAAAR